MSPEVSYRVADPSELEAIARLVADFHTEDRVVTDERRSRAALSTLLSEPSLGTIWLGVAEDVIVGYLILAYGFSVEVGGRDAFVDELYVEASHRRRGIASALLEQAGRTAARAGVRAFHLEVGRGNHEARRVYERAGFIAREQYHLMTLSLGDLG